MYDEPGSALKRDKRSSILADTERRNSWIISTLEIFNNFSFWYRKYMLNNFVIPDDCNYMLYETSF